ncbi:MAG: Gfo/Idh/MocA family oxidoreductase [Bryobacterales bacterium]|nr:Gfo/Idh/MocA family oxidoreductase [Bryobacterales bacterium]
MSSRRSFLRSTVYTLAGAAPMLKAAGPNDTVNLGLIGVGIRGSQLMEEYSRIPGVNLAAAADLYDGYLQHAREFTQGKIKTTKHYEEILANKDLDAVVIATPDHWHRKMTLDALSAGKHVYIEKPLTWRLEDGPEIIAAEKRSGKVLMVGSGGKTTSLVAKTRELIAQGAIGQVRQIRMVNYRNSKEGAWIYPIPPDASPATIDWERFLGSAPKRAFSPEVFFRWRCWWEYSGGVATDLFVHLLTTLHEVMNVQAPVSVVSQGGLFKWKDGRTVPDVLESVFEYQQGFFAQMSVNLTNSSRAPGMVVYGEAGTLVMEPGKVIVTPEPVDRDVQSYGSLAWPKAARDQYLKAQAEAHPAVPRPEAKEVAVERGMGHTEYFIQSIREGKPSKENATEGHAAAGAAHLANRAYREGRKLRWDFVTNKVTAG